MTSVAKVSFEATVAVTRTVEHIAINERLIAVRVTQNGELVKPTAVAKKRFAASLADSKTEMIMTPENLKKFLAGKKYTTENLEAVSEAFLESARTIGYPRAAELHQKEFDRKNATVFERLEAGETLRMVKFDFGGHMLFDDQGGVLPTGLHYDYTNGNMRNGAYDLAKTIDVLNKLPDVYPLEGGALKIKEVPYYNVSSGCTAFLEFVYGPTQEQMNAIWEKAKTMTKTYPSTMLREAAFELDIMGLRAAGAALGKTYYDSGSDSGSDRDDDEDNDDQDDDEGRNY